LLPINAKGRPSGSLDPEQLRHCSSAPARPAKEFSSMHDLITGIAYVAMILLPAIAASYQINRMGL
jgi:hypothetical protein